MPLKRKACLEFGAGEGARGRGSGGEHNMRGMFGGNQPLIGSPGGFWSVVDRKFAHAATQASHV